jgi:hypothetical protein
MIACYPLQEGLGKSDVAAHMLGSMHEEDGIRWFADLESK